MSAIGAEQATVAALAPVLVVDDDPGFRGALAQTLLAAGYPTLDAPDGDRALAVLKEAGSQRVSLMVSDVQMKPIDGVALLRAVKRVHPDLPVLLMTAYGSIEQAVDAMRAGATDYLVKPFEAEVLVSAVSRYARQAHPDAADADLAIVVADPESRALEGLANRVARSDVTVMISGESGVGKELLARFVHRHSPRADGPFVALNCAAIPDNMLEAMLFGYEKGAYTGAHKASPGKFELANGGTLLLDEISEMALGLQAKLLRVLQERELERLGGHQTIALDVRVVATTNRDLRAEVAAARFREDLFYRLNVFPLHIRPLRERPADIPPLVQTLVARHAARLGRTVPLVDPVAMSVLQGHPWRGNVRELDNAVQRALVLAEADRLGPECLVLEEIAEHVRPLSLADPEGIGSEHEGGSSARTASLQDTLRQEEFERIRAAVRACNGNRRATATRLGVSERTLRYKLARMREAGILA